jgi:hypothetical protein
VVTGSNNIHFKETVLIAAAGRRPFFPELFMADNPCFWFWKPPTGKSKTQKPEGRIALRLRSVLSGIAV